MPTKYQKELDSLNAEQKKAVETIEGPVLVIAGPGTGKTKLLTARTAYILKKTDTSPESILCLTFTDSAATVMRERLGKMIGQEAYKVGISTYHSFGSDLIQNYPEYFTQFNTLKHIDELGVETTLRQIMSQLPYKNPLKYADVYVKDVKNLISDAKQALLTPGDIRKIADLNESFINAANKIVRKELSGFSRISKDSLKLFENIRKGIASFDNPKSPKKGIEPIGLIFLRELGQALEEATETGKTSSVTAWKNTWLAKDYAGNFIVKDIKTCQKLHGAADIYEQYLEELNRYGLYDYDDMIVNAVNALEKHSDLRYSLQEKYLYLMLDEFQDTNEAQLRLVELLTDNPVNEGRPNVLAVGDDDQAIYAFQGANYSHMLDFRKMYNDVVTIPLTKNYRSHGDILYFARNIAEQIEQRLHHHFPEIEKTLSAEGRDLPKSAVIERREAKSDLEQFAWTAKRIRQLIDKGISPDEIAVLAPKHRHLEPLVPFLHEQNVPVRYEKRENVLDDPVVLQLLRMSELCLALKARKHEEASALWPEVLSYDFWNIPTSEIWNLSWEADKTRKDWTSLLLKNDELKEIALFFIRLSYLAGGERLELMLDYLVGTNSVNLNEPGFNEYKSPYFEYYFGKKAIEGKFGLFWELLSNLTVLRARLRAYKPESEKGLLLNDLVDFASEHRKSDIKVLNTSPHQEAAEAVQVMTSFKAKGQEFEAVFILSLSEDFWGTKDRSYSNKISLPPNLRQIRYGGMDDDERLRLLYVAITRAKAQLYLLDYESFFNGKKTTSLQYLREEDGKDGTTISPLLPKSFQNVKDARAMVNEPSAEFGSYWQERHKDAIGKKNLRGLLEDRLAAFQLSPTHLNTFVNLEHAGPETFFLRYILKFPETPSIEGEYGDAIHSTLLFIHAQNAEKSKIPSLAEAMSYLRNTLTSKRLMKADFDQLLEKGGECLKAYLKQRAHTISKTNKCEFNFRDLGVFVGDTRLGGKIDKIIVNEEEKTLAIIDYKTGRSYPKWESNMKLHRYKQQLYMYKILIENSSAFKGYSVNDAYLEFVDPDNEGLIRELHLGFSEEEEDEIVLLSRAVGHHVYSLEFPDVSKYPKTFAGTKKFEEYLISKVD